MVKDILGLGVATMEAGQHRAHRKMLNPCFSLSNIRKLQPIFEEKAKQIGALFDRAIAADGNEPRTGTIDCTDTFSKANLDIVAKACLGVELGELEATTFDGAPRPDKGREYSFYQAYTDIFTANALGKALMFGHAFVPTRWLPLQENRKFEFATSWIRSYLTDLVRDRYRAISEATRSGEKTAESWDMCSFIIEESMAGGSAEGISEDELVGHVSHPLLKSQTRPTPLSAN